MLTKNVISRKIPFLRRIGSLRLTGSRGLRLKGSDLQGSCFSVFSSFNARIAFSVHFTSYSQQILQMFCIKIRFKCVLLRK